MSKVRASALVPGTPEEAAALWLDPARWPSFVDGFAHVVRHDPEWPATGAITWTSTPAGRGRVIERTTRHAPGALHVAAIEEEQLAGTQSVTFAPAEDGDGTRVDVEIEYRLKGNSNAVQSFFVRRAMLDALRRTVKRYAVERAADARGY